MVDTRFFPSAGPMPLGDLLRRAGHEGLDAGRDPGLEVAGAGELDAAGPGDIALAAGSRYAEALRGTRAGVVVVAAALADAVPEGSVAVVADAPHLVFADLLDVLFPVAGRASAARLGDVQGPDPMIEDGAHVAPGAVIGPGAEIGRGAVIGPNAVVGAGVAIGRGTIVGANASVECAYLGDDVVLHAGVRVGTEGFGWLDHGRSNRKVPQLGRVIIQDRVEIGANATIDRGALGDTVIGEGTKIDNLVQIGHNCRIGRHCLIAAMTGLSGSTVVGDGVLMGGGVGTSGHISIGDGAILHGRAAVTKDWPAGSKLAGAPAQDIKDFWRELAVLRRMTRGGGT